ncbi:MAG: ribonucleoside-diphosphate reductase, adenosylcobalamin-dependent, partial [Rhodospirillales bacterium]
TRMISAVFRRGGDITFVVDELKAVFDPRGGQWMGGKYVPSLLAAIGDILEQHMRRIGFITDDADAYEAASQRQPKVVNLDHRGRGESQIQPNPGFRQCPKCGQASLIRQDGCDTCTSCAYSRCG